MGTNSWDWHWIGMMRSVVYRGVGESLTRTIEMRREMQEWPRGLPRGSWLGDARSQRRGHPCTQTLVANLLVRLLLAMAIAWAATTTVSHTASQEQRSSPSREWRSPVSGGCTTDGCSFQSLPAEGGRLRPHDSPPERQPPLMGGIKATRPTRSSEYTTIPGAPHPPKPNRFPAVAGRRQPDTRTMS